MKEYTQTIEVLEGDQAALETLIKHDSRVCVSLYLPIEVAAPQSEQNPIRLRSLLEQAKGGLIAKGMQEEEADSFLNVLQPMLGDPGKLLRQAKSTAFFLDENSLRILDLPFVIDTHCKVGDRFSTKALLSLFQANPTFAVAALSRGSVRVFRGSRFKLEAIDVPDMPRELEDITKFDETQRVRQQHSAKTVSAQGRPGSQIAQGVHGHGLPDDYEKTQFERFFRQVGQALHAYLSSKNDPLVVFGTKENIGLLHATRDWGTRNVLNEPRDPQAWDEAQVREEAWKVLEPEWKQHQEETLGRLEQAAGRQKSLQDVKECATAAATGRVYLAAVASDKTIPGSCDSSGMEVKLGGDGNGGNDDLLEWIATETIRHGGSVLVIPGERLPGRSGVAALTRFDT